MAAAALHHRTNSSSSSSSSSSNHKRGRARTDSFRVSKLDACVRTELERVADKPELFLRTTSPLSALLKEIGEQCGRSYFRYVLRPILNDHSLLRTSPNVGTEEITAMAKCVLERLAKALHFAPLVLRSSCHYIMSEFARAFPDYRHRSQLVVGSILFLRIIGPSLVKPTLFEFAPYRGTALTCAAKLTNLLQHTLTGSTFSDAQEDKVLLDQFVHTFHPYVDSFLTHFPRSSTREENANLRVPEWNVPSAFGNTHMAASCSSLLDEETRERLAQMRGDDEPPRRRLRGMSMGGESKPKRKFSLRFWGRNAPVVN